MTTHSRPVGLALAPAPPVPGLASPPRRTRRLILQKARRHSGHPKLRPAGSARVQVLFHSPRRGAFHRSLTVLVHYRSPAVFSLGRWAAPLPTGFRVSGGTHAPGAPGPTTRRLRDSHPLRSPVPAAFGCAMAPRRGPCRTLPPARPTPGQHRRQAVPPARFGLRPFRSPLLRASSLFLGVREMFQFPRCPPRLRRGAGPQRPAGCPIRRPLDHQLPALPQSVSPRGRVLRRPLAPRHPPCAHL